MTLLRYFTLIYFIKYSSVRCQMDSFVLYGNETSIKFYPHSTYLDLYCVTQYFCGGSILNQLVVLTAGHCFEDCTIKDMSNKNHYVKYGHENLQKMTSTSIKDVIVHEKYDGESLANDIALVVVKEPIKLGWMAKRVALLRSPPKNIKLVYMAGWGVMNERFETSQVLLETVQTLQSPSICNKYFGRLPLGTLCAGPIKGPGNPDQGDSGSALIIRKYQQIGIVSFKVPWVDLVAYTNVSYHYNWVRRTANAIVCKQRRNRRRKL